MRGFGDSAARHAQEGFHDLARMRLPFESPWLSS
jgi:hypothetical protein